MTADHTLEVRLAADWPPASWRDFPVVVGVSGGADSVALLLALQAVKLSGAGRLVVAHFKHGLRQSAAHSDERFVVELADRLGLHCEVGRGDVTALATAAGDGI